MRVLLFVFVCLCFKPCLSQDSLNTIIYIPTKHSIVYLDGQKIISSQKIIHLKKGMHTVQAWAPTYNLLEDSFMVVKKNNYYVKRLHRSGKYRLFVFTKALRITSMLAPSLLTAFYWTSLNEKLTNRRYTMNIYRKDADKSEAQFFSHGQPIYYFKQDHDRYYAMYLNSRTKYYFMEREYARKKRNGIIIGSVLTTASLAYVVFTCTTLRKYREKALLSRIMPAVDPLNRQFCVYLQL